MIALILLLAALSFAIGWTLTWTMRAVAPRLNFVDKPGHRKIHDKPKALGGGVAIFGAMALPLLGGILYIHLGRPPASFHPKLLAALWSGAAQQTPLALGLLGAMLAMHLLGLFDDRRAMGPFIKLFIQLAIITALVVGMEWLARHTPSLRLRVFTMLDGRLGMGPWPSIALTVLWIGAITNAFNFLDNMDGLSGGVAAVCATAFLVAALSIGQWFVAAALALLIGALLGFLCFNFAPASIFMGDSGSLLIGLVLGVLTVRTTYLPPGMSLEKGWYAVFAPLIVLALPLYDLIVVSAIRVARGRSPFVGDTNHFSHRLVARGMSKRTAVLCLYLVTAATSAAAIVLPHVSRDYAPYLFVQTLLVLGVVMLLEQHPLPVKAPSPSDIESSPAASVTSAPADFKRAKP